MTKNSENNPSPKLRSGIGGPEGGMTVPEGYFADFAARMAASLPARPELEGMDEGERRTGIWARIRPYVYMAAMFAGVWLMLQMFTMITDYGRLQPMDSNPVLAEALSNDAFVYDYLVDHVDTWSLVDEMYDEGTFDIDDRDALFDAFEVDASTGATNQILPE